MKSKLFTPSLRTKTPTPIQERETAPIFVNPPTHADIPVFSGSTEFEGYPLSLKGSGSPSTPTAGKRTFRSKIHNEY